MRTLLIALVLSLSACNNETPKQAVVYENCSSIEGKWFSENNTAMFIEKIFVINKECEFGSITETSSNKGYTQFATGKIELQKDLFIAHGDVDEQGYQSPSETCTYKIVSPNEEMIIDCGFGETRMIWEALEEDGSLVI